MSILPEIISQTWDKRQGPIVLATVDSAGGPNIIYATCVRRYGEDKIVIADNYFSKTQANILAGSKGALLFITDDHKAYQIKGAFEYLTSGEIFDDMKTWFDPKHPGHPAVVLHVEQVFSGATQLA